MAPSSVLHTVEQFSFKQARSLNMPEITREIIAWATFLVLSIPYVMWAKHPASKPISSYFIFVTIFSVVGWIGYSLLSLLLVQFVNPDTRSYRALQLTVFGISVLIGVLLAHWQIQKPPRASPRL